MSFFSGSLTVVSRHTGNVRDILATRLEVVDYLGERGIPCSLVDGAYQGKVVDLGLHEWIRLTNIQDKERKLKNVRV